MKISSAGTSDPQPLPTCHKTNAAPARLAEVRHGRGNLDAPGTLDRDTHSPGSSVPPRCLSRYLNGCRGSLTKTQDTTRDFACFNLVLPCQEDQVETSHG